MKKSSLTVGLLSAVTLMATAGLVYYKTQAVKYERQWSESLDVISSSLSAPRVIRTPEKPTTVVTAPPAGEEKELIAVLQAELAEKDRELEVLRKKAETPRSFQLPSPEERKKKLEELKQTDPEKYEEIMTRREEFQNRIRDSFAARASTLLDRDPSSMSEEEQEAYAHMLETLNEAWELTERLTSPDTPREERVQIGKELAEKSKELRPMLSEERDRRLYELGRASGYSESESEGFVEAINETLKATSLPTSFRHPRRMSQPPPNK